MMNVVPGLALAGLAIYAAMGKGLPVLGGGKAAFWLLVVLGFAVHGAICTRTDLQPPKMLVMAGVALGILAVGVMVAVAMGCEARGAITVIAVIIGLKVLLWTGSVALASAAVR